MKDIHIVSRLVAKENNLDLDLVEDVNRFFWKEGVRKNLSSMEHTSVAIKHIGTITISKRKVDFMVLTLIRKIRSLRKSVRLKPTTIELLLESNYEKLRKALYQRNILAKQFYENYAKRSSRICEASSLCDEESDSCIGGDLESGEERIRDVEGGRTAGDSEETTDLCDVSIP